MNIYLAGVLLSIAAYIIVGTYAGRKVKNVEDYYVSGHNAPTLLIAGTLFASMLSTNGFMGDTAYCYTGNISTMVLLNTLCASGYIFGALFFGRYIRRAAINTMPAYFGMRFNSMRIRRFAGITTVISLTAYLLAVIQGTGILMQSMTGLDRLPCLLIAWLCFTSFTFYSGSRGVIITDTMMFLLFIGATVIGGPFIFEAAGGLGDLVSNLAANPNTPEDLLDYHGNPGGGTTFEIMIYAITVGIIWMVTVGVSPWQAGRNLMARSEHVIFRSGALAAVCTMVFLTYLYIMAICVIQLNPGMEQPEQVLVWAAYQAMPKLVGVAVLAGIMAAGLSSASTFLSVVSFSLSSDIVDFKFKSAAQQILVTRIVVLCVGLVSLVLAYLDLSSIRLISWFASTIIAASWGFVAFASVWSQKLTERGAYWAMMGGFFGYLLPKCMKEVADISIASWLDPFFVGCLLSILLGVLGSMGQKKSAAEQAFQDKLHITPMLETKAADYRRDRVYGWLMVVVGAGLAALFIGYWALPYNAIKASL